MGLLKFLSFGKWNVDVSKDNIEAFITIFIIICVLLLVKLVANLQMDNKRVYDKIPFNTSIVGRSLNVLLYIGVLSIASLFNNMDVLFAVQAVIIGYIIIVAIVCGVIHDCDEYWAIENKFIVALEGKYVDSTNGSKERRKNIKNINKRIYDYKKRAIIG